MVQGKSYRKPKTQKPPFVNLVFLLSSSIIIALSIWAPERMAKYRDRQILDEIHVESAAAEGDGYRYALSSSEKLAIFSEALSSHLARNQAAGQEYQQLAGAYAFIVNHRGPYEKQITGEEIYNSWNQELLQLKALGIVPEGVEPAEEGAYTATLYSAIDVLEPRNNVDVWNLSLSGLQKDISRKNKLIEAYVDGDDGKVYEFYVRTEWEWEEVDPDAMVLSWSEYIGLEAPEAYGISNPLAETTPYFKKYRIEGAGGQPLTVTVGFYEGINELFLKVSR